MANERKNSTHSSRKSPSVKNQFSNTKTRNIHTMQGGLKSDLSYPTCDADGSSRGSDPNGSRFTEESGVSKLIKLLPNLCQIKKRIKEYSPRGRRDGRNSDEGNQSQEGELIDISPPTVKAVPGKLASRKISRPRGSRQQKKEVNPKIMFSTNQPRLSIGGNLNVKVSGPMSRVVDEMMESNIKNVVTMSGAGMSTSAGIPDFRSPNTGIYDKLKEYDLPYPQAVFEKNYFDKNPKPFFALLREMLAHDYRPTVAHYFVKMLEEKGLLLRHITQNVDGLERLAGVSQNRVIEAHGSVYASRCLKCKKEYDLQWLRDRLVIQGKEVPKCQDPHCLGMVKPNIVLFGEALNPRFLTSVKKDIPQCDLLIIIGTSLVVEPFASTVKKVSKTCPRVIVNNKPVGEHLGIVYEGTRAFDRRIKKSDLRDVFVQGSCDEGVVHLANLFQWESDMEALIKRCEPESVPQQPASANHKNETTKKEKPTTQHTNGTDDQKHIQSSSERYKNSRHLKSTDQIKIMEKEEGNSVVNRAKNMWKRIASSVLKPEF